MTNNKQQTAVEWLFNQMFDPTHPTGEQINWLEQAKEMEKDQHEKTWAKSRIEKEIHEWYMCEKTFNEYYNETYINNQ
jgi:hypothetical protein